MDINNQLSSLTSFYGLNNANYQPTSVAKVDLRPSSDMPKAADYYVDSRDYTGNVFERFGDWFSGRDRNAEYQSAQALMSAEYQDAYNKWLASREDSQYQRMVKDLEKAGLNPWLAIQNGLTGSGSDAVSATKTSAVKLDKKTGLGDIMKDLLGSAIKLGMVLAIAK